MAEFSSSNVARVPKAMQHIAKTILLFKRMFYSNGEILINLCAHRPCECAPKNERDGCSGGGGGQSFSIVQKRKIEQCEEMKGNILHGVHVCVCTTTVKKKKQNTVVG